MTERSIMGMAAIADEVLAEMQKRVDENWHLSKIEIHIRPPRQGESKWTSVATLSDETGAECAKIDVNVTAMTIDWGEKR